MKKYRKKVYAVYAAHILIPAGFAAVAILLMSVLFYVPLTELLSSVDAAIQQSSPHHFYADTYVLAQQKQPQSGSVSLKKVGKIAIGQSYGWISSEDFALDAYIYYGDDEKTLNKGVCQYTGSGLPGYGRTILLCGHDTTYLKNLGQAKIGDVINIRTQYGAFRYRIVGSAVTTADDTEAARLDEAGERLVLYTCYPFGKTARERQERYFVYCEKISGPLIQTE